MKKGTMDISINVNNKGTALIVLRGKLSIESIQLFEEKINSVYMGKVRAVILDIGELRHIDSSGIGSLIRVHNTARNRETEFILCKLPSDIYNIFLNSSLDNFFNIKTAEEIKKLYPEIRL